MSIECPACFALNEDHAKQCINCKIFFEPDNQTEELCEDFSKIKVWKVRCPGDGRIFIVNNEKYKCEQCAFENDDYGEIDFQCCKPFQLEIEKEAIDIPMLILAEISAEIKGKVAYPQNTNLKSNQLIYITEDGIIGRAGDIEKEYFENDFRISARHCSIFFENGWYVEQLSEHSPTGVDGMLMGPKIKIKLHDNAMLQIGDKLFVVKVLGVMKRKEYVCDDNVEENNTKWIITCPRCGWNYVVNSKDDVILKCEHCDIFDEDEISHVKAVQSYAN